MSLKTSDVFKTQGRPDHTYVSVTAGEYERSLTLAIQNRGTLSLIAGPSKTGKTTLVSKVAEQLGLHLLTVRCDGDLTNEDFWRKALEKINFERMESRTNGSTLGLEHEGKIGGTLGWKWLAGVTGEYKASAKKEKSEEKIRQKILAKPSPDHLVPVLKECKTLLVIEDFHYLRQDVQKTVFQQWKSFVDEQISVIVIGTSHHACDLAYANKDLVGRISVIELTTWLTSDLKLILHKGCNALNIVLEESVIDRIANESAGLPIVTQSIALELMHSNRMDNRQDRLTPLAVTPNEIRKIFTEVAQKKYAQFKVMYDRLIAGLRNGQRSKAYECLLLAFSTDPISFSLKWDELVSRIRKLNLPSSLLPTDASIKNSLKGIRKLQKKMCVELMEWVEREDTLYIVEPTFLFYLRWRKQRSESQNFQDLFAQLFGELTIVHKGKSLEISLSKEGKAKLSVKNKKTD